MAQSYIHRLQIKGPEGTTKFDLPPGKTLIGREPTCPLPLLHSQVSRRHAEITCLDEECIISDLESANGTVVNGEKLIPHVPVLLKDKAVVTITQFILIYEKIPVIETKEPLTRQKVRPAKEEAAEVSAPFIEQSLLEELPTMSGIFPPPPEKPPIEVGEFTPGEDENIPGLELNSTQLIQYLPGIYQTEFISHFLALFESILLPIEWNIDNFDLFLDPGTAPTEFINWLAGWMDITFDSSWDVDQRRAMLREASQIYARRGTRWALSRVLEIYTGQKPKIVDSGENIPAFTFIIEIPANAKKVQRELIERIINSHKPAHATYTLKMS